MASVAAANSPQRRHTFDVPPQQKRRYSSPSEWLSQLTRGLEKRRAASTVTLEQQHTSPAPPPNREKHAPDGIDPIKEEEDAAAAAEHEETVGELAPLQRTETWQKRLNKRMSVVAWNPDWAIQGALPAVQESVTGTFQAIRRMSRTEPSHETNFPPSDTFPDQGGLKVTMAIYGIIDAVSEHSLRLLLHQGMRVAEVPDERKGKYPTRKPYELPAASLKNGDWICHSTAGPYADDPSMAMVLRGEIQRFDVKCRIVGMFPIKTFGERVPETYEMEMTIF